VEFPAAVEARIGVARGVAPEVLEPRHRVRRAQRRRHARVLQAPEQQHHEELRQKLQAVLVPPLHAVEHPGVLVLALLRIHHRPRHPVPPARPPHLLPKLHHQILQISRQCAQGVYSVHFSCNIWVILR
jgi:hypothetical protein